LKGPLHFSSISLKKNELDIYDIPIHEITQQYLEYIQIMKELNLEVAGEFVAMAATLIYIKSRMLVPQYDENGEVAQEDPRKELVQQLLEYQRYQEAGKQLYKRPIVGRDLWLRGAKETLPKVEDEIIVDEKGLFALISAYRTLMKETVKTTHRVTGKGQSISAKLMTIKDHFKVGGRIELKELLPNEGLTKVDLIVTFLAVLELARLKFVRVYQSEPYSPLYIETMRAVTSDVVSAVQEFDAADAAQAAEKIMIEAAGELEHESMAEEALSSINSEDLENDSEVKAVEAGEIGT